MSFVIIATLDVSHCCIFIGWYGMKCPAGSRDCFIYAFMFAVSPKCSHMGREPRQEM